MWLNGRENLALTKVQIWSRPIRTQAIISQRKSLPTGNAKNAYCLHLRRRMTRPQQQLSNVAKWNWRFPKAQWLRIRVIKSCYISLMPYARKKKNSQVLQGLISIWHWTYNPYSFDLRHKLFCWITNGGFIRIFRSIREPRKVDRKCRQLCSWNYQNFPLNS